MLKKLQNLLFEDEEDDILDDEEDDEVVLSTPAKPAVTEVKPAAPAKPVAPAPQPAEPTRLNRIDVTTNIPTAAPKPAKQEPKFPEFPAEEKKTSIGITADDTYTPKPKAKTVKPAKPIAKKETKKTEKKVSGYQFQPVISPIFGVDEKDLNAVKNTAKKVAAAPEKEDEGNITPVISPIYGSSQKTAAPRVSDRAVEEEAVVTPVKESAKKQVEDEIPEFSLDDILKVRDEQYDDHNDLSSTAPLFPDLSFPDEPEDILGGLSDDEPDQTQIFNKPLSK